MALSLVTLTGAYEDGEGRPLKGYLQFIPSAPLTDTTDTEEVRQEPVLVLLRHDGTFSVPLYATDSADLAPAGWCWQVTEYVTGLAANPWSFFLAFANGSTQDISALTPVSPVTAMTGYLPVGGGTLTGPLTLPGNPTAPLQAAPKQYVDAETARAEAAEAASAAAVSAETSRAGAAEAARLVAASNLSDLESASTAVTNLGLGTAATQDTSAFDAAGSASAAQSFATSAVAAETSRAETAEAGLLPLSSLPLAIGSGGTGSQTQNFVDLTTGQAIAGTKTFSGEVIVPAPVNPADAATKAYVDAVASGLQVKNAVQEATTTALPSCTYDNGASGAGATLTGTSPAALVADGQTVALNDRVLVQNQAAQADNGIYVCSVQGDSGTPFVLTRSTDMNTPASVPAAYTFVQKGSLYGGSGFTVNSTGPYTIGTTAITWTQFSSAGTVTAGTGLTQSGSTISLVSPVAILNGGTGAGSAGAALTSLGAAGTASNLSDLASASAARANLGLGTAATQSTSAFDAAGTAASAVAPVSNNTSAIFSPLNYGAYGDGTHDDTIPLQNCAAETASALGVMDLGTRTFKTTAAIPVSSNLHVKGSGLAGGAIINAASDLFTVTGGVSAVIFEDCCLTSAPGGGHIWNAGTASMSFWNILGVQAVQNNPGKSIWYQTGGLWIDCTVDKNCILTGAAFATVSPWSMTGIAGGVNSVRFGRMRCNANSAPVPFFLIDPQSAAGWNEEIVFDHITFEVTTGGAIAVTGCIDVLINVCSLWDIPGARFDTGLGATFSNATVTDSAAVSGDLGKAINGPGITPGTVITSVSGTTYTISQAATATASGVTLTIGGPAANQYSFTQSAAHYGCQRIVVRGGRANENTASAGTGFADFFADSRAASILIDSFGSWGVPSVISAPPAQTIILNQAPVSFTTALANRIPGTVLTGAENAISSAVALTPASLGAMSACTVTAAYTVTLPTPVAYNGQQIGIRVTPSSTKLLTLATAAGNIDGAATRIMWAGESAILESDGTRWVKIAGKTLPMQSTMVSSGTSITSGTVTNIPLTFTYIDNTGLMCDPATNQYITVQRPGNYEVVARVAWSSMPANCPRAITVAYKNGNSSTTVAQDEQYAVTGGFPCRAAVGRVTFAASDYCTLSAFQNSGQAVTTVAAAAPFGGSTILALTEVPSW